MTWTEWSAASDMPEDLFEVEPAGVGARAEAELTKMAKKLGVVPVQLEDSQLAWPVSLLAQFDREAGLSRLIRSVVSAPLSN
jgi:hypothetical protein